MKKVMFTGLSLILFFTIAGLIPLSTGTFSVPIYVSGNYVADITDNNYQYVIDTKNAERGEFTVQIGKNELLKYAITFDCIGIDVYYNSKIIKTIHGYTNGETIEFYWKANDPNHSIIMNISTSSDLKTTDYILSKTQITTIGSGLYKDNNKYIYKGKTGENYITFNDELWRIISLENDGKIKIIKNEPLKTTFSINGLNIWSASTIREYFNESIKKDDIEKSKFYVGEISNTENKINSINSSQSFSKIDYIGLLSLDEYLNSSSNICDSFETCSKENWIKDTVMINPYIGTKNMLLSTNGELVSTIMYADYKPIVYLKSNLKIAGTGTLEEPYFIKK